jgi:hypothetical protein
MLITQFIVLRPFLIVLNTNIEGYKVLLLNTHIAQLKAQSRVGFLLYQYNKQCLFVIIRSC